MQIKSLHGSVAFFHFFLKNIIILDTVSLGTEEFNLAV